MLEPELSESIQLEDFIANYDGTLAGFMLNA